MARTAAPSVDAYLEPLPDPARRALTAVRAALREALPDAVEVISYQIPTLKVGGRAVLHYAAFQAHWSLLPASTALLGALGPELRPRLHGKATLRFAYDEPVPQDLLRRVAVVRLAEVVGEAKARTTGARK